MVVMRRFYSLVFLAVSISGTCAAGDSKTYALVAAVGNRFEVMTAKQSVGSHLPPWDRAAYLIGGNVLNRLALQGLDQAVERYEPESKRVYLSLVPARPDIELVIAELKKLDRVGWDRIMVALPASRYGDEMYMRGANRMKGMGLLAQPLCQTNEATCDQGFRPSAGPVALTPGGEEIPANTFVAPFAFVEIVTLDPRTLAVPDRSSNYGHRKLTDETGKLVGVINGDNKAFLATQIVDVVQTSTAEAMANGILKGNVDVQEKGPVK